MKLLEWHWKAEVFLREIYCDANESWKKLFSSSEVCDDGRDRRWLSCHHFEEQYSGRRERRYDLRFVLPRCLAWFRGCQMVMNESLRSRSIDAVNQEASVKEEGLGAGWFLTRLFKQGFVFGDLWLWFAALSTILLIRDGHARTQALRCAYVFYYSIVSAKRICLDI